MRNKAVFIDRDGTINIDGPYLDDPDKFVMYPGVGEGVKKLKDNGFKIIVMYFKGLSKYRDRFDSGQVKS